MPGAIQVGSKGASEGPKGRRSTSCRVERADPVVRGMVERAAMLVSMSPYNTEPIQVRILASVFFVPRPGGGGGSNSVYLITLLTRLFRMVCVVHNTRAVYAAAASLTTLFVYELAR